MYSNFVVFSEVQWKTYYLKKNQLLISKIQSYALKGFFSVNLFDKQGTYSVCKLAWPEF